jgi:hypothetical protein
MARTLKKRGSKPSIHSPTSTPAMKMREAKSSPSTSTIEVKNRRGAKQSPSTPTKKRPASACTLAVRGTQRDKPLGLSKTAGRAKSAKAMPKMKKCDACVKEALLKDISVKKWSPRVVSYTCRKCEEGSSSNGEVETSPHTPPTKGHFYTPPGEIDMLSLPTLLPAPRQHRELPYWENLNPVVGNELSYYATKLQID